MIIADRIRELRESKDLSQGDMERKTGLLRCYISRVENGHTMPTIDTLEKIAHALELPLYQLLYDGEKPPKDLFEKKTNSDKGLFGHARKEMVYLSKLRIAMGKASPENRKLLMAFAEGLARQRK